MILAGIKVLDLTRAVSGPHCTRMLSDLGADVVKVEPPGGDGTRRWGQQVNGLGSFFSQQNCGKRSVCLDLAAAGGVELCRRLASVADIAVENFRPGVMERLGLGYDVLAAANPRLIFGSITGYGQQGERANRRAFANVVLAETGSLERQSRWDGRPPTTIRFSAADTYASLELLAGLLAAAYDRERTGLGQRVDVAMADAMLAIDDFAAFDLWDGPGLQPDPVCCPTADGHVVISANPAVTPEPFLDAMGRRDLLEDPRFGTREARLANRASLVQEICSWSAALPTDAVELILDQVGLAAGVVRSTREALDLARREPRPVVVDVDDRAGGSVQLINSPQRFSRSRSGMRGVVPRLGEHNDEVMSDWLALTTDETRRLVDARVLNA
jgi:crotonobetainyl-CoA:carnitine CoA-transferase CaiB-like acyl-CoA transferase